MDEPEDEGHRDHEGSGVEGGHGVDEENGAGATEDGQDATDGDGSETPDGQGDDAAGDGTEDREEAGADAESGSIRGALARFRRRSRRQQFLRGGITVLVFCLVLTVALVPTGLLGLAVSDSATFTAAPAAPGDTAVTETGYELTTADTVTVTRRLSPAGQERTIIVRNQRRTYERTVQVQNSSFTAGVFVTLSSPTITVAGQSQNPLAGASHRDVLGRFESQLDTGSGNLSFERVGQRRATMLGSSTTVSVFETNVSVGDQPREVAVYVTTVREDGDIVVAIGLHPTAFADQRVAILRLIHSVEHPTSGE